MIAIAQIGVKHGHAAGKTHTLRRNSQIDFAGIYEPDSVARQLAQQLPVYAGIHFFQHIHDILDDPHIQAVAIEGSNWESLAMAQYAASAGKHLWLDKPAGDDWTAFQRLIATVTQHHRHLQLGYMFRYHHGFTLILLTALCLPPRWHLLRPRRPPHRSDRLAPRAPHCCPGLPPQ
ncbi:MAG: Gfo/Idh/MocA family oxidoreductase [Chloroflexi bacterium]|nr:Gfo/Idh/MocA family oxidoreductase [Chloroflexota bacterium]